MKYVARLIFQDRVESKSNKTKRTRMQKEELKIIKKVKIIKDQNLKFKIKTKSLKIKFQKVNLIRK